MQLLDLIALLSHTLFKCYDNVCLVSALQDNHCTPNQVCLLPPRFATLPHNVRGNRRNSFHPLPKVRHIILLLHHQ